MLDIFFYLILFFLGTMFGSFASVIISRIKLNKSGILFGRSECPKCKHTLTFFDLFPIFSYFFSKGKCRYCKTKISIIYPILELSTGLIFLLSGFLFVDLNLLITGNNLELFKLIFILFFSFFTITYIFYDILYLEIPEIILLILIIISFIILVFQSIYKNFIIFQHLENTQIINFNNIIILLFIGLLIIGGLYIIMLCELKEIYDILILSFLIICIIFCKYVLNINIENIVLGNGILGVLIIFIFFYLQIFISKGAWLGGGDLRIAILMGLIGGLFYSYKAILISYLFGSLISILYLVYLKFKFHFVEKKKFIYKIKKILGLTKKNNYGKIQIPFGPFLAIGIFGILFFYEKIDFIISRMFIK